LQQGSGDNMEEFTDLNSLYTYLEKNATNYKYSHQIGNLFQKLKYLYDGEKKTNEAEMAQWEIDFFYFMTKEGELIPMYSSPNDKGEIVVYPTLEGFDSKTYDYLFERLKNTSNPLLRARYSHILWCSPKKHAKYAKIAVNSYLELVGIYEAMDKKEPDKHYGLLVLDVAKNAYFIACHIKYNMPKVKYELDRLVRKFNPESSSAFTLKFDIIKVMLKDKKRFEKRDFIGYEKICLEISKSLIQRGNIHFAIDMLELGEKIDQKLGKKTHN
jgi:hypothetical protein